MGFGHYGHFRYIYFSGPEYCPSDSEATMKNMDKQFIIKAEQIKSQQK